MLFIAFVHLSGIVFVIAGIFVTVVKKGSGTRVLGRISKKMS
ncbi:transporter [Bacillus paralicheniformis]|nr:transporter [Bacillus paralicheniformis]OLQ45478.1 transporter [Bacillus paralicheniformis]TWM62054.1 hypothetical protein CHCC14814_3877 [Bacillus paralicheniformis]